MLFSIAFGLLVLTNCNSKTKKELDLTQRITEKLTTWNFMDSKILLSKKADNLTINILFSKMQDDKLNSYYMDRESNFLIASMISYIFYDDLVEYNSVNYSLEFEDGAKTFLQKGNIMLIALNRKKLKEIKIGFDVNKKFYAFVEYSFKNLSRLDVAKAMASIEFFTNNVNGFDYDGTFWSLLKDYSSGCEAPSESLHSIFTFVSFVSLLKDPNNPSEDDINQEVLNHFIVNCGYSSDLLKMNLLDLLEYFDTKYDKNGSFIDDVIGTIEQK